MGTEVITIVIQKMKIVSVCVILRWVPRIEKRECIHEVTCDLQECNR